MRRNAKLLSSLARHGPPKLAHAWWACDAIRGGSFIDDSAGGAPLVVTNPAGQWSIIGSGVKVNRLDKAVQTAAAFVTLDSGPLKELDTLRSFTIFGWVWPESTDINSDGFTKPVFGYAKGSSAESGVEITLYNGNAFARLAVGGTEISALSFATVGTIGVKSFYAITFSIEDRLLRASKDGAAFTASSSALPALSTAIYGNQFNLGNFVKNGELNSVVPAPDSRNMRGKWDEVGLISGKAISDTEVSWLYNAGNGRTYSEAVTAGLFDIAG